MDSFCSMGDFVTKKLANLKRAKSYNLVPHIVFARYFSRLSEIGTLYISVTKKHSAMWESTTLHRTFLPIDAKRYTKNISLRRQSSPCMYCLGAVALLCESSAWYQYAGLRPCWPLTEYNALAITSQKHAEYTAANFTTKLVTVSQEHSTEIMSLSKVWVRKRSFCHFFYRLRKSGKKRL